MLTLRAEWEEQVNEDQGDRAPWLALAKQATNFNCIERVPVELVKNSEGVKLTVSLFWHVDTTEQ